MARHRHSELRSAECEFGADPTEAEAAVEIVRRATRGARAVAFAALVVAAVASAGMAVVLFRVQADSVHADTRHAVFLQDGEMRFDDASSDYEIPGYYRVFLNTVVREDRDIKSAQVRFVSVGETVYIAERKGRRVRIIAPTKGWMSMETTDGVQILRPDLTLRGVRYSPNASAVAQAFQSKAARHAAESAMRTAAEFTKLEDSLLGALKHINQDVIKKPGEAIGHALKSQPVQAAGKAIAQGAMELSKGAARAFVAQKRATERAIKTRLTKEQQADLSKKVNVDKIFGKDGNKILGSIGDALRR